MICPGAGKIYGNATHAQPGDFEANIQIEFARDEISAGKLHETRTGVHQFLLKNLSLYSRSITCFRHRSSNKHPAHDRGPLSLHSAYRRAVISAPASVQDLFYSRFAAADRNPAQPTGIY